MSILDALGKKYSSPEPTIAGAEEEIHISGKTVEEIGFDKIARQLATLHELRIVVLDGMCVGGLLARPRANELDLGVQEWRRVEKQELKIQELDLESNLIEEWADVVGICSALRDLRVLGLRSVLLVWRWHSG